MKLPLLSVLPICVSMLFLSGCQSGGVQLHDHVRQDLQTLGVAADESERAEVKLHDHVEADLQRWRDEDTFHVRLDDHVREDLNALQQKDLNIRFHDHVLDHLARVGLEQNPPAR